MTDSHQASISPKAVFVMLLGPCGRPPQNTACPWTTAGNKVAPTEALVLDPINCGGFCVLWLCFFLFFVFVFVIFVFVVAVVVVVVLQSCLTTVNCLSL